METQSKRTFFVLGVGSGTFFVKCNDAPGYYYAWTGSVQEARRFTKAQDAIGFIERTANRAPKGHVNGGHIRLFRVTEEQDATTRRIVPIEGASKVAIVFDNSFVWQRDGKLYSDPGTRVERATLFASQHDAIYAVHEHTVNTPELDDEEPDLDGYRLVGVEEVPADVRMTVEEIR